MNDSEIYPFFELGLKREIDALMEEIGNKLGQGEVYFNKDGFYPYYSVQSKKILFIGRESRGLGREEDYIHHLLKAYQNKRIYKTHINRYAFHRRLMKISYGLINGAEWRDIPAASEIAENFATRKGISFAFMNLSKISKNHENSGHIHVDFMENVEKTKYYIKKEISILKPDIIIGMNIINSTFKNKKGILPVKPDDFFDGAEKPDANNNSLYVGNVCGKTIVYVDSYHFSARNKKDEQDFFDLIKTCLSAIKNSAVFV